ncbi:MAG: T9SS type A sorting domain-containing protein [Salibacteraceae bacterium]
MRVILTFLIITCGTINSDLKAQTGTVGNPYTELKHAWRASSNGIYYFNIGGTSFSSYVESGNGWILAASGDGGTTESSYSTTTALTLQSDAILPSSIYTNSIVTAVRINATSGPNLPFDVQSSDAGVLSNLQNDNTLSDGTNSGDWSGTGTARLARSCASGTASLSSRIYHSCGNGSNLHWQVGRNSAHEKIVFTGGTKNDLNLWIRATEAPLPIELINFDCRLNENNQVTAHWSTASEINNDFFTLENSIDGKTWKTVSKIMSKGNFSDHQFYSVTDSNPIAGFTYYRLKQTDFNGDFSYSTISTVEPHMSEIKTIILYPNPTSNFITISNFGNRSFNLFDGAGTDYSSIITSTKNGHALQLNLSDLNSGIYFLLIGSNRFKVMKR